ncbi:MAG: hypothetical protein ACRCWD_05030 [Culicoidibacterales bacterium]
MSTKPKKRIYKTEFQDKITAYAPTDPEVFVFDTEKKVNLVVLIATISTATTLVIGGLYHLTKKIVHHFDN